MAAAESVKRIPCPLTSISELIAVGADSATYVPLLLAATIMPV